MSNQAELFPVRIGGSAGISPCGRYRYTLHRLWGEIGSPRVNFVMLNPSIADASLDDPTIRKCIGFARRWGFGGLTVTNLFAWRSTDPRGIGADPSHVGPENDGFIRAAATFSDRVVFAWGAQPGIARRAAAVTAIVSGLGVVPHRIGPPTKDGHPCHPLMLAYSRTLEIHPCSDG